MLNCIDAFLIDLAIIMSGYNCVKFVIRSTAIRHFFITVFYLLTFFCLVSWEITAIAQVIDPDTRYLVFQKLDNPQYYHVAADIS